MISAAHTTGKQHLASAAVAESVGIARGGTLLGVVTMASWAKAARAVQMSGEPKMDAHLGTCADPHGRRRRRHAVRVVAACQGRPRPMAVRALPAVCG